MSLRNNIDLIVTKQQLIDLKNGKISEKIIDNIGKYLGLNGTYKDGFIYFPLTKTYDSKILKTILTHYDARCYINTTKETFVLVVF